jgi:hypothetical protein
MHVDSRLALATLLALPVVQLVQLELPGTALHEPGAHAWQAPAALEAPCTLPNEPGAHCVHALVPLASLHAPAGHWTHVASDAAPGTAPKVLIGHGVHVLGLVAPSAPLYEPAGQASQELTLEAPLVLPQVPCGQDWHVVLP